MNKSYNKHNRTPFFKECFILLLKNEKKNEKRVNTLSTEDVDSFLMIIIATDLATLTSTVFN